MNNKKAKGVGLYIIVLLNGSVGSSLASFAAQNIGGGHMERLKSGNLFEVARVVKGLMQRESDRGLSNGERKMLHSAKEILISEIVLSKSVSYEDVEARINTALA